VPKLGSSIRFEDLNGLKHALLARGEESHPLLDARLAFSKIEGRARYARMLAKEERVYPLMLPTQASGRWSTSGPPLVNFPPTMDCLICPDPDSFWVKWDWDAIEAKILAALSDDREDLEAFAKGCDVHTITTCFLLRHALPPNLANPHTSPECEEWRQSWVPVWETDKDENRRRHAAKIIRYNLAYSFDTSGRAVLAADGIEDLGLDTDTLISLARRYLTEKKALLAYKRQHGERFARTAVARTIWGHRRRLYGDDNARKKEGLNHEIQGCVADMMNQVIISVDKEFSESRLILNKHDALITEFPGSYFREKTLAYLRPLVERKWTIGQHQIHSTASWKVLEAAA